MLALIAEDDRSTRVLLTRLLQKLEVETLAVENGLELLALLEKRAPNLVLLDFEMPFLNGFETLQAIRSAERFRNLPVICVSSHSEEHLVRDMIALGLTDYLVKPIHPEHAMARLRPTVEAARRWQSRPDRGTIDGLMVVDNDPNFRAFLTSLLGKEHEIIPASSGAEAVALFRNRKPPPSVVLVSDSLPLLSGEQLAGTFRRVASSLNLPAPRLYLLAADAKAEAGRDELFDGVLAKSFIPKDFRQAFAEVVRVGPAPAERLTELLRGELGPEVVTAARQALGALAGQEAAPVDATDEAVWVHRSALKLAGFKTGTAIEVALLCDEPSLSGIASKMGSGATSNEPAASAALGKLAETVAGRIRASLLIRSIDLQLGPAAYAMEDPPVAATAWPHAWAFACPGGERFVIGCRVVTGPPTIAAPDQAKTSPDDGSPAGATEPADLEGTMAAAPRGQDESTGAAGSDPS